MSTHDEKQSDKPDSEGWVAWSGSDEPKGPLSAGTLCDVRFRGGQELRRVLAEHSIPNSIREAKDAFWRNDGAPNDIIAYRVIESAKPKLTIDALAQEIRRVDGNHSLGAGALAEALMPYLVAASGGSHE